MSLKGDKEVDFMRGKELGLLNFVQRSSMICRGSCSPTFCVYVLLLEKERERGKEGKGQRITSLFVNKGKRGKQGGGKGSGVHQFMRLCIVLLLLFVVYCVCD